jgi:hypothetical protein
MATELLKCSFSRALEALTVSIADAPTSEEWTYQATSLFEFT